MYSLKIKVDVPTPRSTDTLEYIIGVGHYDSNLQKEHPATPLRPMYKLKYKAETSEKADEPMDGWR